MHLDAVRFRHYGETTRKRNVRSSGALAARGTFVELNTVPRRGKCGGAADPALHTDCAMLGSICTAGCALETVSRNLAYAVCGCGNVVEDKKQTEACRYAERSTLRRFFSTYAIPRPSSVFLVCSLDWCGQERKAAHRQLDIASSCTAARTKREMGASARFATCSCTDVCRCGVPAARGELPPALPTEGCGDRSQLVKDPLPQQGEKNVTSGDAYGTRVVAMPHLVRLSAYPPQGTYGREESSIACATSVFRLTERQAPVDVRKAFLSECLLRVRLLSTLHSALGGAGGAVRPLRGVRRY
ncbi:unnamed protein product [Rangifer tarandus platyrhynchus]|uniref:Uncharacterized protein n=1 Tax=Rangifer tarandus platyrhynchus TaxID=3082113 RepID=A0ABN8XNF2_RANTA|nr:unnamed protein product [Rangifer tarandus platyrhynchus]